MDKKEIKALIGTGFPIHGVRHTCVAAEDDALLLLQFDDAGAPIQYVTAHHPSWFRGELVWDQGEYFPLFHYDHSATPMADALRDAALAMSDENLFVAMADDDLGARCVGVFTGRFAAESALESILNKDADVQHMLAERRLERFTLDQYKVLYDELCLENAYWIEEHTANHPAGS